MYPSFIDYMYVNKLFCFIRILYFFSERMLGTPNDELWPGVSSLRDWHEYPQWKSQNLARAVPALEPEGVDLLSVNHHIIKLIYRTSN